MEPLQGLTRSILYRAAVASLAFGLIIPSAYANTADDPFVTDLIAGGGNPASALDARLVRGCLVYVR